MIKDIIIIIIYYFVILFLYKININIILYISYFIYKLFMKNCLVSELCCLLIIIIPQTWSHVSDVIAPKNESYSYQLKVVLCRYFAIQEKYFYIILIHVNMAVIIGSIALLAAGTMILTYFKHICGIFRIAR